MSQTLSPHPVTTRLLNEIRRTVGRLEKGDAESVKRAAAELRRVLREHGDKGN